MRRKGLLPGAESPAEDTLADSQTPPALPPAAQNPAAPTVARSDVAIVRVFDRPAIRAVAEHLRAGSLRGVLGRDAGDGYATGPLAVAMTSVWGHHIQDENQEHSGF